MQTRTHAHTHTRTHARANTHTHARKHAHTHTHTLSLSFPLSFPLSLFLPWVGFFCRIITNCNAKCHNAPFKILLGFGLACLTRKVVQPPNNNNNNSLLACFPPLPHTHSLFSLVCVSLREATASKQKVKRCWPAAGCCGKVQPLNACRQGGSSSSDGCASGGCGKGAGTGTGFAGGCDPCWSPGAQWGSSAGPAIKHGNRCFLETHWCRLCVSGRCHLWANNARPSRHHAFPNPWWFGGPERGTGFFEWVGKASRKDRKKISLRSMLTCTHTHMHTFSLPPPLPFSHPHTLSQPLHLL